ncbi:MAG: putative electron transfer flavoprotein FixA [Raoultibacter sp.]
MNIVLAFKVVPDDQDVAVSGSGELDFSKAKNTVSTYDLNALEAAVQLAHSVEGSSVVAMTVGDSSVDDSKVKKNVLARGVDELYMTADDNLAKADAHATAGALADLLGKVGAFDLVICGDGSADNYAQQVDVQLAARLGLPVVNAVTKMRALEGALEVERTLEDSVEIIKIPLPCVISVSPDVAVPRIPGMKDILAAGKKPMNVQGCEGVYAPSIELVSLKAPEQADRKLEVLEASADGAVEWFAAALKAAF